MWQGAQDVWSQVYDYYAAPHCTTQVYEYYMAYGEGAGNSENTGMTRSNFWKVR